jgi:ribosomal protein S27AE
MPRQPSHTHKLKRHKYPTGNAVYFCTLPDCHYKIDAPLALGKRTLCNICGNEFIMNEYTVKLTRPHCPNCGKVKVKDAEGKDRYVKKVTNQILSAVATETSQDLRSRLDTVIGVELEDDI